MKKEQELVKQFEITEKKLRESANPEYDPWRARDEIADTYIQMGSKIRELTINETQFMPGFEQNKNYRDNIIKLLTKLRKDALQNQITVNLYCQRNKY